MKGVVELDINNLCHLPLKQNYIFIIRVRDSSTCQDKQVDDQEIHITNINKYDSFQRIGQILGYIKKQCVLQLYVLGIISTSPFHQMQPC